MAKTQTFRSKASEHVIQLACIAWFRNEFERKNLGCIIPVVNEATYDDKTQVIKKGASDLIVVLENTVLFIEMKNAIGVQKEAQEDFEKLVTSLNFKYYLCRNLDTFKSIVYENL